MFRFDSAERANREPAAGVSLQVGPGSVAGFFERLHRAGRPENIPFAYGVKAMVFTCHYLAIVKLMCDTDLRGDS